MPKPLNGKIVLDLGQGIAGPWAATMLADLGARVIRIEQPGQPEPLRQLPPLKDGRSAIFAAVNHSKLGMTLDLGDEDGRAIFDRLLDRADVLIETAGPCPIEKRGYGWPDLHRRFPRLILGTVSGNGLTGPDARRPSSGLVVQARSGALAAGIGGAVAAQWTEYTAALFLVQGVLAALLDRQQTGTARKVDLSLLDTQVAMLTDAIAACGVTGAGHCERGPERAPADLFAAADGSFVIAAETDALFEKLCLALSLPLASDPRFAGAEARSRNAALLRRLIEAVTLGKPRAEWVARLTAAGIPSALPTRLDQALRDPQVEARNMVVDVLDRNGRTAFKAAGTPVKISDIEDRKTRAAAPDPDGNRGEILRWLDEQVIAARIG